MSDDPRVHVTVHNQWATPLLDLPMSVPLRRKLAAWVRFRRAPVPITPLEAQRLVNKHLAAHLAYISDDPALD